MKTLPLAVVLLLMGAGCTTTPPPAPVPEKPPVESARPSMPEGVTIRIDGQPVDLQGTTHPFGAPVYGDLDADGDRDAVMLIQQNSQGSGTFYYVAVATNVDGSYEGSNAVFLGDRIAPQNVEIREDGLIIANYADRNPGEPFTTQPSRGVSKYLRIEGGELKETTQP